MSRPTPADLSVARDLLAFMEASPTPFHCVAEVCRRLDVAGFTRLDERAEWSLEPGRGYYVVRGGGSVAALRVGSGPPEQAGFRAVGAHTDSPDLRLKPRPAKVKDGYLRADVEAYGGAIWATWVDRDLGLAGRLVVRGPDGLEERLVLLDRPVGRIPSVAIHLDRKVNDEGLKVDKHRDLGPTLALVGEGEDADVLLAAVADAAGVDPGDVLGHDLSLYDRQPPCLAGLEDEFVLAGRLDNQAMCHAALTALVAAAGEEAPASSAVVCLFDHEEVDSGSTRGASGPLLADVLTRVAGAPRGDAVLTRALAGSLLVSADMTHAVHPARADLHDGEHLPRLNGGPAVKTHSGQRYATDARTGAAFRHLCRAVEVPCQEFVIRGDLPCGSTIGPITAAGLGIPTVDVGNPLLSMHSVREMAGSRDPAAMTRVLEAFLGGAGI